MPVFNPGIPGGYFPGGTDPLATWPPEESGNEPDEFVPSFTPEDFEQYKTQYTDDLIAEFGQTGTVHRMNTITIADDSDSQNKWIEKKTELIRKQPNPQKPDSQVRRTSSITTNFSTDSPKNDQIGQTISVDPNGSTIGIGESEVTARLDLYLFVSHDGAKLYRAWHGISPKSHELLIFIENNERDRLTDSIMLLKAGNEAKDQLTTEAVSRWVNETYSISPEAIENLLNNPVNNETVLDMVTTVVSDTVHGIGMEVANFIAEKIGWVFEKIDKEYKYQPNDWNPAEKGYIPALLPYQSMKKAVDKKEEKRILQNTIKGSTSPLSQMVMLSSAVAGAGLDIADSLVEKLKERYADFQDVFEKILPNEGQSPSGYVQTTLLGLYQSIDKGMSEILEFMDNSVDELQELFEQAAEIVNAFFCGFINGLIDLINGIIFLVKLYFLGIKAKHSFYQESNYYIRLSLEMMDNLLTAIEGFDWSGLMSGLWKQIKELGRLVGAKIAQKITELTPVEWAYYIGYIVFNIVEMFIPYGAIIQGGNAIGKAGQVANQSRRFANVMSDLFQGVAKTSKQAIDATIDLAKKTVKAAPKGVDLAIDIFNWIVKVIRKGTDEVLKFFKKLFERLKKWLDDAFRKGADDAAKKAQKLWDAFSYDDLMKIPPTKKPCFLPGTLVHTPNGCIPIEKIKEGSFVHCYSPKLDQLAQRRVLQVYSNWTKKFVKIAIEGGEEISATGKHLFFAIEQQKWVMANSLEIGMEIYTPIFKKGAKIKALKIYEKRIDTFNLEIEEFHNYLVGNIGLLTHNAGKVSLFERTEKVLVEFYHIVDTTSKEVKYVGQTIQDVAVRFGQHALAKSLNPIKFRPQSLGPKRLMTPYEAHVFELFEINKHGGKISKANKGTNLWNKKNPISKAKFEKFKKLHNPCKFF